MKLFIIFLLAFLPTFSFGLKCYKCSGCENGVVPTKIDDTCKPHTSAGKTQTYEASCFKQNVTHENGHIVIEYECGHLFENTKIGCTTVQDDPKTKVINCYCLTDLCNTVEYDVPAAANSPNSPSDGCDLKIHALVGITFAAVLSSTVFHNFAI